MREEEKKNSEEETEREYGEERKPESGGEGRKPERGGEERTRESGGDGGVPSPLPGADLSLISLLSRSVDLKEGGTDFVPPKPYSREIFLFETHVAGTSHVENIVELEPSLKEGDRLVLVREPGNPYDGRAIRIQTKEGEKIGYVPRKDNMIFARLMDAGKVLFAVITEKEWDNDWLRIGIRIYMSE